MTIIVDTGPMLTLANRNDPERAMLVSFLEDDPGQLIMPAPVTAEVDYMIGRRVGAAARRAFLNDLASGRYTVACLEPGEYATVEAVDQRYSDLDLGLADVSIIVLARRFGTRRLLTHDAHFRTVAPLQGGSFAILPADA